MFTNTRYHDLYVQDSQEGKNSMTKGKKFAMAALLFGAAAAMVAMYNGGAETQSNDDLS